MFKSALYIPCLSLLILSPGLYAQNINRIELDGYKRVKDRKVYSLPQIPGYVTLTADLHMHSVFSDGLVWPDFRLREAWVEGLDVIALTDHIEILPHKNHIASDHNTSVEIARELAGMLNIILIKGSEITRGMPPGHFNALFIEDANLLDRDDPLEQLEEAAKQGAFILWNHPGWASQQPDTTIWWDMHTTILENGWLHGVEVANSDEWYPVVLDWCKEKELAVIANSDVHEPVNFTYDLSAPGSHRPMTLIFAGERTPESVKEALFDRRTLGFMGTQLMGFEELLHQVFYASVEVREPYYTMESRGRKIHFRELVNHTDLTFILEKAGEGIMDQRIELYPHSMVVVRHGEDVELRYNLVNSWSGSDEHPVVILE